MSLFKLETPVLSRQASIASTPLNQSGAGSDPSSFNLIPTEYIVTLPPLAAAGVIANNIFIADDYLQLVGFKEVHITASTSGTLQLEHLTGIQALGAGTSMLTGTVSNAGAAATVVSGTPVVTPAAVQLAPGDRIGLVVGGTMTNLVGSTMVLYFKRWQ